MNKKYRLLVTKRSIKNYNNLETIFEESILDCDVIINEDKTVRILANSLNNLDLKENDFLEYKDMYLILGILADKDVEHMVKVITPKAKKVFTVTPNSMRAETAEELMNEVKKYNESCEAYNDYKNAFEDALKLCKKDDLLLISGSLYMIGEMRGIIKKIL